MGQSKFTISLLGFDQRSADMLGDATSKTMKIIDPISAEDTQVVVIDIDVPEGIALWDEFRQQWPQMPAVVASENDPEIDHTSFAEKPFTVEELIDNITEAMMLAPPIDEDAEAIPEAAGESASKEDTAAIKDDSLQELDSIFTAEDTELDIDEAMYGEKPDEAITEAEDTDSAEDTTTINDDTPQELEDTAVTAEDTEPDIDEMMHGAKPEEEITEVEGTASAEDTTTINDDTPQELEDTAETAEDTELDIDGMTHGAESDKAIAEEEDAVSEDEQEISSETADEPEPDKALPPLSEIAGILSSHSSAHGDSTIRKLDTPNPDESYFDPDAHIIGLVLKGIEEGEKTGKIAKIACLLDRAIYVDAQHKLVRSNLKDIHMRQIAIAPLGKGENGLDTELEMIDSISFDELEGAEGSVYPMESFVWELAVLTSKGRAPKGTPMDEPTYLMQWPNFTRLMPVPYAMKVAAYWLRLPSSLNDLSENMDVPINEIRSLYSAASLTGLAGLAKRNSDRMLRPGKPEKHEKRNLFGAIMGSLKKG